LAFLAIIVFTGAHRLALGQLDSRARATQANLDEAARIRAEAEALLVDILAQRDTAEAQGRQLILEAEAEAARLAAEAREKLEEQLARRTALAERRIAAAESQAAAEVKAAAVDIAVHMAESVLAVRMGKATSDPLVDASMGQLAARIR
jgi:F-type H+-transporting ATPase subunit b